MHSQPEDPRIRKANRKDKGPIRLGDATDGKQQNKQKENPEGNHQANIIHVPFAQNISITPNLLANQPVMRKNNLNDTSSQINNDQARSPTNAAFEGIKRAAESPANGRKTIRTLPQHEYIGSAVPRRPLETSDIPIPERVIVQPEWTKSSSNQNFFSSWEISQRLSNQHAISNSITSNNASFEKQIEKGDEGMPRKINHEDSLLPMTNSTNTAHISVPIQNLAIYIPSSHPHEKEVMSNGLGNAVNNQNINSNNIFTNNTQYARNDPDSQQNMFQNNMSRLSAEGLLLSFIQNQNNAIMTALTNKNTTILNPFNTNTRKIPNPEKIASKETNFMQNLKVDFVSPNQTDPTSTHQSSKEGEKSLNHGITGNSIVNYYLLLHYFISQQANTNKTHNIFLLLDRIHLSLTHQNYLFYNIPSQTKVRHLKQYFPHLAAIQKWRQYIADLIKHYNHTIQNFRKRNTLLAEEKLLKLKLFTANSKKTVDILNQNIKTLTTITEETKSSIDMIMAYNRNDRLFTYSHPSDPMLQICQMILRDYRIMRDKTNDMLEFTPLSYTCCNEVEVDGVVVLMELLEKLAQESGKMVQLQARVRKMKKKMGEKIIGNNLIQARNHQAGQRYMKEHWRTIDLLSEVGSLLRKRSNRNNEYT